MRTPYGGHPESRLAFSWVWYTSLLCMGMSDDLCIGIFIPADRTTRKDLQEQRPSAPALGLHAHGAPRTPREPRLILSPARVHTLRDPDPKSESVHQGETPIPVSLGSRHSGVVLRTFSHRSTVDEYRVSEQDLTTHTISLQVDLDIDVKEYAVETASAAVLTGGANRLGNPGAKLYVWALVALIARLPREVEVVRRHSGCRQDPFTS
ncbi:hypothetical protein NMY22_g12134 [Coprinellus aureogranulatus]|nr:hypothetical protein NMY22_g12134 [Coprinellus aureogranulatus]